MFTENERFLQTGGKTILPVMDTPKEKEANEYIELVEECCMGQLFEDFYLPWNGKR